MFRASLLMCFCAGAVAARVPYNATISNVQPRRDDTGAILRVQDGCLQNFGGTFYLYGARYQCCNVSDQPGCCE